MMLMSDPPLKGWLCVRERNGTWTPSHQANGAQMKALYDAVCARQAGRSAGRKVVTSIAGMGPGGDE